MPLFFGAFEFQTLNSHDAEPQHDLSQSPFPVLFAIKVCYVRSCLDKALCNG